MDFLAVVLIILFWIETNANMHVIVDNQKEIAKTLDEIQKRIGE